ncbi:phytanoyl-CoA dioxygenase family protein [Marihabitans asiaticum]|uniref:Ectoine hydroxylase-related dioxygenase (Phytanoyl-CoA dioxygenase family) n=2 Tax=Marihabitans asiaticum TaxID=415218 RepID=A0A560WG46_9MICO|nr:ectoine hydroxylase-related dioxygenase (phytanoyl-CoA dioxygenase family) [Marihabitans asiaticum]
MIAPWCRDPDAGIVEVMTTTHAFAHGRLRREDCHLDDLTSLLASRRTEAADYPFADRVEQEVLVYDSGRLRSLLGDPGGAATVEIEAEIARALADGPGIVVFEGAFDPRVIEPVSRAFEEIIADQRASGQVAGDHFAKPGANDRVWNALQKLALHDPDAFVDYYANDLLALAARAWLGPGYQVTSQVNVVNPGGEGQTVHRDYHLGFQSPQVSEQYPAHVHALSPALTLQGAVAHVDMPIESGPTLYLPHSQLYPHGYLAYWLEDFQEHFRAHHVQLPLAAGDAVFFNPALFHAAGTNRSRDIARMANLLQISSAFGRAMEAVDRAAVVESVYPALLARRDRPGVQHAVAAAAEGYAFPTNLDLDQPVGGMSPATQADLVREALDEGVEPAELRSRLEAHGRLSRP